jgi:hypothetical protein
MHAPDLGLNGALFGPERCLSGPADVDRCWQSFLRRFDLEHTFRPFKQVGEREPGG